MPVILRRLPGGSAGIQTAAIDDRNAGVISPFTSWSLGPGFRGTLAGLAWPAANRALFVPFRVPVTVTVTEMVVGMGSVAGGNFDAGIYDAAANLVVSSGSQARVASSENIAPLVDTDLTPGLYYLALAADTTNQYAAQQPNTQAMRLTGMRQAAAAFPLPASVTFAAPVSNFLPWFCAYINRSEASDSLTSWPPLNAISGFHTESLGIPANAADLRTATITSFAPGANAILYAPFSIEQTATAVSMGYIVGGVSNGNVLMGIYAGAGALVVSSASTAQGSANVFQEVGIADTTLSAGFYFMAIQFSSATGTVYSSSANDENVLSNMPIYGETAGGFALPATMTPVLSTLATPGVPAMAVYFDALV